MTARNRPLDIVDPSLEHFQNRDKDFTVGLVHPFLPEADAKNRLKSRECLSTAYLTASLEAHGFDVLDINAELENISPREVADRLLANPHLRLVGISTKAQRTYRAAKVLAELLKAERPEVYITVGGVFPTAADVHVLADCEFFDSVTRGEGEHAIVELAARVSTGLPTSRMLGLTHRENGEIRRNPDRPRIQDLDALPWPSRRDMQRIAAQDPEELPLAYIVSSRGCYARCSFCSIHQIYGDHLVMRRSPESVVGEMQRIVDTSGVRVFHFVDDLFIFPSERGRTWLEEFCALIGRIGLKVSFRVEARADSLDVPLLEMLVHAGLWRIFVGMESGCDSVLERWDKGLEVVDNDRAIEVINQIRRKYPDRFDVVFGYIMFDPEMTYAELKQQYSWLRHSGYCKVDNLQGRMNVYWGTPYHTRMVRLGRLDPGANLGERWSYAFDDRRVGAIESCIRRFLDRYRAERAELLLTARSRAALVIDNNRAAPKLDPIVIGVLRQALARVEGVERSCWYHMYDTLFAHLDAAPSDLERVPELGGRVWDELGPAFDRIDAESRLLLELVSRVYEVEVVEPGAGPARPYTAWRTDGVGHIRLESGRGYRAVLGHFSEDHYETACEILGAPDPELASPDVR